MKRKDFLKVFAITAASSSLVLSACGEDPKPNATENANANSEATDANAAKPAADCNDLSGLSEADIKQRESVSYVALSTEADKNCLNCRFFKAAEDGSGCGSCQLIKGPVSPDGNCKSWFKKDA